MWNIKCFFIIVSGIKYRVVMILVWFGINNFIIEDNCVFNVFCFKFVN